MSTLQETLARLAVLIPETGHSREETLNTAALARDTADPEEIVESLLNGQSIAEADIDQRVTRRVKALFLARIAETGHSRTRLYNEAAAHLQISSEWARLLLNGEKIPNIKLLSGLETFFGRRSGFFQCTAADALDYALQPVLKTLDAGASDPMTELMNRFNLVAVARRGKPATHQQETMMTQFITAILESDPEADK